MCLYSMKNLLDLGVELDKRVRLILGTSEETTWEGIDSYVAHEESPTIGFSPDAEFPLINAEKTIAQFDGNTKEDVDFEIEALGAYNATPDRATYKGNKKEELKDELDKLNYKYKEENNLLVVIGKSSHGMNPQLGINAIVHLCVALYNIGEHSNVVDFVANKINGTYNGEKILGETIEDFSGKLTLNLSRIQIKDGIGYFGFDSRIPVLANVDDIIGKYTNAFDEFGIVYSDAKIQDKLYIKEDSPLVTTLMNIYKDETGEKDAKPLAIGGGTYARAFDNCVAFGSVFISQNQIDRMHQPNECLEVKFIKPALNIYTRAIYELSK